MQGYPPSVRLLGIGAYVAITIVICTVGGKWLDGQFDTGKLFTLVGLTVGLFLALYGGVQQLMEVVGDLNRRRMRKKD